MLRSREEGVGERVGEGTVSPALDRLAVIVNSTINSVVEGVEEEEVVDTAVKKKRKKTVPRKGVGVRKARGASSSSTTSPGLLGSLARQCRALLPTVAPAPAASSLSTPLLRLAQAARALPEEVKEEVEEEVVCTPDQLQGREEVPQQCASPGHVRTLFSPPTPQKSLLKTLSPQKKNSPRPKTSSAWNKELKEMLSAPSTPTSSILTSSIPFTEETIKAMKRPITVARRMAIPIRLPASVAVPLPPERLVPVAAEAIPRDAVITSLPPGYTPSFHVVIPPTTAPSTSTLPPPPPPPHPP